MNNTKKINSARKSVVSRDKIEFFVDFLEEEKRWITAEEVLFLTDIDDPTLRAIKNANKGRIMLGQKGYKAAKYSTPQEIFLTAHWLNNQGKEMLMRTDYVRRRNSYSKE